MPFDAIRWWLFSKRFLLKRRFKVVTWCYGGKKYLTIRETGWRGVKWERRFEIAHELDDQYRVIPFQGEKAVKP